MQKTFNPSKKPKLLWLTQGNNQSLPSLRLRVLALQEFLSNDFFQKLVPAPTTIIGALAMKREINEAEVVILQKELVSLPVIMIIRSFSKILIYDFDDAVYVRLLSNGNCRKSHKRTKRFRAICRACDGVHAGNRILAEAAAMAGAKKIVEIPTAVNPSLVSCAKPQACDPIRVGWIGTSANLVYLENLEPVFNRIIANGYRFQLRVMSNIKPNFVEFDRFDFMLWSQEREQEFLDGIDIGIMPLENNEHTRGKCAYKALQYMSHAKPVVISDVGVNAEWTKGAGMAVSSFEEYYENIVKLIVEPKLRELLGENGREIVAKNFSRYVICRKIIDSISSLLGSSCASRGG